MQNRDNAQIAILRHLPESEHLLQAEALRNR
jgi:hypothetical protein